MPLALTLKGFRGIRDGLRLEEITLGLQRLAGDAELIAIAGANGSGKTTIMDSLLPFIGLQVELGTPGQVVSPTMTTVPAAWKVARRKGKLDAAGSFNAP